MGHQGALHGLRVLELTSYISGPYTGMILGDLGADIIKVEPPNGDPMRGRGRCGHSPTFGTVNRNKRSLKLDFRTSDGRSKIRHLARDADVLIENFRLGTLDRIGLGYEDLRFENPRLIYCSINGFGDRGPAARKPGYDTVGQAMSGILSLLTDLADPQPMGISFSDHLAGISAAIGILAALQARSRTGAGQKVGTSILEASIGLLAENAALAFETGEKPSRATRTHIAQVFAFLGSDDRPFVIHLSSPPKFWSGLLAAISREDLASDPRFAAREGRVHNYDALHAELASVFKTYPREHWLNLLAEQDVPSGPLHRLDEAFADPQVAALDLVDHLPHPTGPVPQVRLGIHLSGTPVTLRRLAPELGEQSQEIEASIREGKSAWSIP